MGSLYMECWKRKDKEFLEKRQSNDGGYRGFLDIAINRGDRMVREKKRTQKTKQIVVADKSEGKVNVGMSCIGNICFTEDGFLVKIGKDCDPEFVKEITKRILGRNSKVTFEINPSDDEEELKR